MIMKHFIIYEMGGTIIGEGTCAADDLAIQRVEKGKFILEGVANSFTQKVVGGKVVDKTPAEITALRKANPKLRFDRIG